MEELREVVRVAQEAGVRRGAELTLSTVALIGTVDAGGGAQPKATLPQIPHTDSGGVQILVVRLLLSRRAAPAPPRGALDSSTPPRRCRTTRRPRSCTRGQSSP